MSTTSRWAPLSAAAVLILTLAGCFNPFDPRIGSAPAISEPPPRPDTPRNTLLLFRWCWEHRDWNQYRELLTDDFRFAFAATDTFGNAYLVRGWTRDDELESAKHLFITGKADQPVATRITLDFLDDLVAFDDSRPGKNGAVHKEIFTKVRLSVDFSDGTGSTSSGSTRFFLTRGDSALIPLELPNLPRDSTRWYIERYEEQEVGTAVIQPGIAGATASARSGSTAQRSARRGRALDPAPAAARLSRDPGSDATARQFDGPITWGHLKALYR